MIHEMYYLVTKEDDGSTIKDILRHSLSMSTRLIKNLKYQGKILKNEVECFVTEKVAEGDRLLLQIFEEDNDYIEPKNLPIEIVAETEHYCVVNKPKNMPTHPSSGHHDDTLLNALAYVWQKRGEAHVMRPINRLDRNTTGLLLLAKTQYAAKLLTEELQNHQIKKEYVAIVTGKFSKTDGAVTAPIGRAKDSIIRRCVTPDGKSSHTIYRVLKQKEDKSLMALMPVTGRTHQLRVHMSYLGHPLIGDTLYGDENGSDKISRFALHCCRLSFIDPLTQEKKTFSCPMPPDMQMLWDN